MSIERRTILTTAPILPALFLAGAAEAATTDLVLNCDPAAAPALRRASDAFYRRAGVRVRVFPTGPGLIVPQLVRRVQNDIVFTQPAIMSSAIAEKVVAADAPRGQWRNALVIGGRTGATGDAVKGRLAVTDPTPASDMDGPAILTRLGLAPASILGVIDTDEVADLVLRGQADAGLLHVSDVKAHPDLIAIAEVAASAAQPIVYAVAVTALARRPNPDAFVDFLTGPAGRALLHEQGLEA